MSDMSEKIRTFLHEKFVFSMLSNDAIFHFLFIFLFI